MQKSHPNFIVTSALFVPWKFSAECGGGVGRGVMGLSQGYSRTDLCAVDLVRNSQLVMASRPRY